MWECIQLLFNWCALNRRTRQTNKQPLRFHYLRADGGLRFSLQAIKELILMESLILAQNERWRRGLGMQVGRA